MTQKRTKDSEHVQILVSGVPATLLRQFDLESYRLAAGKRGGGGKLGSGRSGLIVKAMEQYLTERKRRARQNKVRKSAEAAD